MPEFTHLITIFIIAPALLMGAAGLVMYTPTRAPRAWACFAWLSGLALLASLAGAILAITAGVGTERTPLPGLLHSLTGAWMAVLVQLLGTVIGAFSARYLQGEPGQQRYIGALGCTLAAVHVMLLADHWLVLIGAWSMVGRALQWLLCFYKDRPFAQLAAYKKRIADSGADGLLLMAALLAWQEVGSGSLSALKAHLAAEPGAVALQASAVLLVLAVFLRTAVLPVHGWLIQVMESPTPVSALLHAGVINLGAYVLVRLGPLVEAAAAAQVLLVLGGLGTAALAGLVMLTRVSIKLRLAWSTVAQMGFMLMQCGLGLYTFALLHLLGHSLYKAHSFLGAASVVRRSKLEAMRGSVTHSPVSLLFAPLVAGATVFAATEVSATLAAAAAAEHRWPWWWSGLLALAWAPLLWLGRESTGTPRKRVRQCAMGIAWVAGLTLLTSLAHAVPLGVRDASAAHQPLGILALLGMGGLYIFVALLQWQPQRLEAWRRWSYAGFYLDAFYTRLALHLSSGHWQRPAGAATPVRGIAVSPSAAPQP